MNRIRLEPIRIYAIVTAIAALVAHYHPNLPTVLIMAVAAAVLGTGEVVRSQVSPTVKSENEAN